jgi:hypothetical protein
MQPDHASATMDRRARDARASGVVCVPARKRCIWRWKFTKLRVTVKYFALTETDRFRPTVGWKLLKPSAIEKSSVRSSFLAPFRRPSVARSRRRVARSRQALRASRTVIGYDRVSTPRDLAPSSTKSSCPKSCNGFLQLRRTRLYARRAIWCTRGRGRCFQVRMGACMSRVLAANPPNKRK